MRRAKRLPAEKLAPYLVDSRDPQLCPQWDKAAAARGEARRLVWHEVFGNDRPVEVEIGFGKGLFLLTSAVARPDVNFLGVELERKLQLLTATRLAKRGIPNVRLACADARLFLGDRVATASVQALHVYFPDPWWKTRHRKRRLFSADFASECARVLRPGGHLWLATDVKDYFAVITSIVAQQPQLLVVPSDDAGVSGGVCQTNFERKALDRGCEIHRAVYIKRA